MMKRTLLILAVGMLAATSFGQLKYQKTIYDGYQGAALADITSLCLTHEGRYLYVASTNGNGLSVFERSEQNDSLIFLRVYSFESNPNEIRNPTDMAASKDNKYLYVTATGNHSIFLYEIDPEDGSLYYVTDYEDRDRIRNAADILVSEDNRFVYATSTNFQNSNILVYRRDIEDGTLTFIEEINDQLGQDRTMGLVQTKDGKFIYAISYDDSAIGVFEVDSTLGTLKPIGGLMNGISGLEGMENPMSICLSPGNQHVFIGCLSDNGVLTLKRDSVTGLLEYSSVIKGGVLGVPEFGDVLSLFSSTDGKYVIAISQDLGAINIFSLNPGSGELGFVERLSRMDPGGSDLYGANTAIQSPDGNFFYVSANRSETLGVYSWNETQKIVSWHSSFQDGHCGLTQGLGGASDLIISKDNNFLYCSGQSDGSIVTFKRDHSSGDLTYLGVYSALNDGITEMDYVRDLAISPDDNFIYASAYDAVLVFSRSAETGNIEFRSKVKNRVNGVAGLNWVRDIALSPDGIYLYASGKWDNALAVFHRDKESGTLTFVEAFKDQIMGTDGLATPTAIQVSNNNKYVYIGSLDDNSVSVYQRNFENGKLTKIQQVENGDNGIRDLIGAMSLLITKDDRFLYVLSTKSNRVFCFSIDSISGILNLVRMERLSGLNNSTSYYNYQAFSADESYYYLSIQHYDKLLVFKRDSITGKISLEQELRNGMDGNYGLSLAQAIVTSPDQKHVYITSLPESTISIFENTGYSMWIKETEKDFQTNNVYPNPTNGQVRVQLRSNGYYEVYNTNGQLIRRSSDQQFDLSKWSGSIFIFRIFHPGEYPIIEKIIRRY